MTEYLYLSLNLGSIIIPLLYSVFEKDFHFIKHFKKAIFSITIVAIPFLIWDIIFTDLKVWGFNETYHLPFLLFGMPIEEWLFFFCIPYSCLFTHEVLKYYFPKFILTKLSTVILSVLLLCTVILLLAFNFGKYYTTINLIFFLILIAYCLKYEIKTLQKYYPSFLIILIPFFIINGILTGSIINQPIVWYNNNENVGFRIFTIPIEDVFYAFNLLLSVQLVFNYFITKKTKET